MRKAASVASKQAETAVRQQMEEVVVKLQAEVNEKTQLLTAATSQLEIKEMAHHEITTELHNLQAQHNNLLEVKHVSWWSWSALTPDVLI